MELQTQGEKTVEIIPEGGTYHVYRNAENASLDAVIVSAVAELTQRNPMELEPLSNVVDAEALERLFASEGTKGYARFQFGGGVVTLHSDTHLTFVENE